MKLGRRGQAYLTNTRVKWIDSRLWNGATNRVTEVTAWSTVINEVYVIKSPKKSDSSFRKTST